MQSLALVDCVSLSDHSYIRESSKPAENPARFLVFPTWGAAGVQRDIALCFYNDECLARAVKRVEEDAEFSALTGMAKIGAYFKTSRDLMFGARCLKNGRLHDHPSGLPAHIALDGDGDVCEAARWRHGRKVHELEWNEQRGLDAALKAGCENIPRAPLSVAFVAGYARCLAKTFYLSAAAGHGPAEEPPRSMRGTRSDRALLGLLFGRNPGPRPADLPASRLWPGPPALNAKGQGVSNS